jgi:diguanylate cyclase (GGDEF)-like protein/PAS domain S-box-containing protein
MVVPMAVMRHTAPMLEGGHAGSWLCTPAATAILDRIPEAVGVVGTDGVAVHLNPAAREILEGLRGYRHGLPVSATAWGAIDARGEPLPGARLPVEITRLCGEECTDVEVGFPTPAGDVRWLRINTRRASDGPAPFAVMASFADVTQARRTIDELDRERERYRTVVESLHEGLFLQDAEGRIVASNRRAEEVLGLSAEELTGRTSLDSRWQAVRADGTPLPNQELPAARALVTGEPQLDQLIGMAVPGGGLRWLTVNATPLKDRDGSLNGVVATFTDVSQQRAERDELRQLGKLFATAFSDAPTGMGLIGSDGRWQQVNRTLCDLLGYSEEELRGRTPQDITHPDDLPLGPPLLQETLAGKRDHYELQKRYVHADGRAIWAHLSVSLVRDDDGTPLHLIAHITDITERLELQERLQTLADRDSLTGMFNRRRFEEELETQLARCARFGERAALAMIDLDGFKRVNDTRGHAAGDEVLRSTAQALSLRIRATDTLARLGGDEFAVILLGVDEGQANALAMSLAEAVRHAPGNDAVTASVGVTPITGADTADRALARADAAMYAAKRDARP